MSAAAWTPHFDGPSAALVYLVPALVWGILAEDAWRFRLRYRPRSGLYRLLPFAATAATANYVLFVAISLALPLAPGEAPPRWFDLTDVAVFAMFASMRHMVWYFWPGVAAPSRRWLLVNYGIAGLLSILNLFPEIIWFGDAAEQRAIARLTVIPYVLAMLALIVYQAPGIAGRGWRAGRAEVRSGDAILISVIIVGVGALFLFFALSVPRGQEGVGFHPAPPLLNAGIGLLAAAPFAMRVLGDVVKRLLFCVRVLVLAAVISYVTESLVAHSADLATRAFLRITSYGVLAFVVLESRTAAWAWIEQRVFRRDRRRYDELQALLHELSPELGVHECCRRLLAGQVRAIKLRGAAILLTEGRGSIVVGRIDLAPIEQIWRGGETAAALPSRPFGMGTFRELPLPLQEALVETEVVGVVPIRSPRRIWGAGFIAAGPLQATFSEEDRVFIQSLADQLALLLDSAELLERVVSVERSLAHAAKLSAIGEVAARIVHEIRNPITAARSLAQSLSRDPTSPLNAESAELILAELERVERQVSDLLRFSRRDELQLEDVDLGVLAHETAARFGARGAASGVDLEVDAPSGVVARADREKLRQVLINLVENSFDALEESGAERRISVSVGRANGAAILRVSDTGPGVEADALARVFEPFFTTKERGTGLGLAIVKQTVDAHGGAIEALPSARGGFSLQVKLP